MRRWVLHNHNLYRMFVEVHFSLTLLVRASGYLPCDHKPRILRSSPWFARSHIKLPVTDSMALHIVFILSANWSHACSNIPEFFFFLGMWEVASTRISTVKKHRIGVCIEIILCIPSANSSHSYLTGILYCCILWETSQWYSLFICHFYRFNCLKH